MVCFIVQMRAAVRDVAKHFPAAIVTGRCVEKVYSFVGLSELYYAGSHGMDIKGPSSNVRRHLLISSSPKNPTSLIPFQSFSLDSICYSIVPVCRRTRRRRSCVSLLASSSRSSPRYVHEFY